MIDISRDTSNQKILTLLEENNKLLRKMHRAQKWASVFRSIYWIIIIGTLAGSFYYFQPFFTQIANTYQLLLGAPSISGDEGVHIPGIENLSELFDGLGEE